MLKFTKKQFLVSCVALASALVLTITSPTLALTSSQKRFYGKNHIYWYNPDGNSAGAGCYIGDITISGSAITEKIWSGLLSFMTPEQAAGAMGNMANEGGFNPARHETSMLNAHPNFDIVNDSSISYGIGLIQWSFGRRTRLLQHINSVAPHLMTYFLNPEQYGRLSGDAFLAAAGDSVTDQLIQLELQYLRDELQSSYPGFFQTSTVFDAAKFFLEQVERPRNPTISAHMGRVTAAEGYYNLYNGASFINLGSSSSSNIVCGGTSTLQQLVLKYAWPTYYSAPYTAMRSDYSTVVAQRSSAGKYVGGAGGLDCGGFVTTLMQESGFAPNYNSGNGNAAGQESWVKSQGWILLNGSESSTIDTSILQPGDVAFSGPSGAADHTFVYVGNIPGFSSNIASASAPGDDGSYARAPMAGRESLTGSGTPVRWYRKAQSI